MLMPKLMPRKLQVFNNVTILQPFPSKYVKRPLRLKRLYSGLIYTQEALLAKISPTWPHWSLACQYGRFSEPRHHRKGFLCV
jgi:hypothetical protein